MEKLCDLFFEFSNEDRLRMLHRLRERPSTVTAISKDLGLTTQEASRHLTRLGEMGLTVKGPSGAHVLTPYGELSLAQLRGFSFTCRHSGYFTAHNVSGLPAQFVARLGELDRCAYIDDVMVIFHRIEKAIREAEEYVWRLTDRYIITAIPAWEAALRRGVEFRLMDPRDIVVPPEFDRGPVLTEALTSGQFRNNIVERVDVFMALTEREVAGICFPEMNGKMDYRGFASDDPEVHRWAHDLYEYYWGRSTVRMPF